MNENHKTSDFVEATVLLYFGHRLEYVDKSHKRAVFHFTKTEETDGLLGRFWAHTLVVEPYAFYQCERELKSRLYGD
jgi:hypothetical protein